MFFVSLMKGIYTDFLLCLLLLVVILVLISFFPMTKDQSLGSLNKRRHSEFSDVLFEPPFAHAILQRFQQMKQLIMKTRRGVDNGLLE